MKIAEINFNKQVRLGFPPTELLTLTEAHLSTRTRLALRAQQLGFSDQNQRLSKLTLTPTERRTLLDLDVSAVEAWMEEKIGDDTYRLIEVVNLAEVERARLAGRRVVAFHGEVEGDSKTRLATFSFDIDGQTQFRLWYDAHERAGFSNSAQSVLPDDLNILVELEAAMDDIDKIVMRLARRTEVEEERLLVNQQIAGWQSMKAGFAAQVPQWEALWKEWLFRSRGSQVSGNLPRQLKRGLWK